MSPHSHLVSSCCCCAAVPGTLCNPEYVASQEACSPCRGLVTNFLLPSWSRHCGPQTSCCPGSQRIPKTPLPSTHFPLQPQSALCLGYEGTWCSLTNAHCYRLLIPQIPLCTFVSTHLQLVKQLWLEQPRNCPAHQWPVTILLQRISVFQPWGGNTLSQLSPSFHVYAYTKIFFTSVSFLCSNY